MSEGAMPADVRLEEVVKEFGETRAVDGISLEIPRGSFFALLGPSGCGKTTTLRMIGGFEDATSGRIFLGDRDVVGLPPYKRDVNTVFQSYALFPHMTVAQNVAFGLRMSKLSGEEVTRRTDEYLELVGLAGLRNRLPSEMSGGQQQRVALARALAKQPAVLLLDEPLGALDLKLRKSMQTELTRIHRQVGTTFVFVTHDQDEALSMATRIAIMSGGKVAQTGSPREVYERPVNRFVADFVGETTFLVGSITREGGTAWFCPPGGERVPAPDGAADGEVTLMVRPEALALRPIDAAAGPPGLRATIVNAAFLGNHTRITLATAAGEIVAIRPHGPGFRSATLEEQGQEVCVWWRPDDAAIIGD